MNKIARLSALAVVLAASVGTTAFAATSTVTGGYAQSDMQGKAKQSWRFQPESTVTEQDNNPLKALSVPSPTPRRITTATVPTTKVSTTASPLVRLTV